MNSDSREIVRKLGRVRVEVKDWCRNQPTDSDRPPYTHRRSITHQPEVWTDGEN